MDFLAVFIPTIPFIAAVVIGLNILFNRLKGLESERSTSKIANGAITLSCLLAIGLLGADILDINEGTYFLGTWLSSEHLKLEIGFNTTGFNVILTALFSILLVIITRFSVNYIHKERGFHRFFFILSLFTSAMLFLVLSTNMVGTFIGWEIAGLCSYFLIGYAYDRSVATTNATRVFVTNRIGDAGFILGIGLTFYYTGTTDWNGLSTAVEALTMPTTAIIALCFVVAAFAKSVQLPFTPWLARAMEGPTPSSALFYGAVMVHAGIFLIIVLQPVIEKVPLIMGLLIVIGLSTAIYSFIVGLTQTDIKSSVCFAISGQLGLMFLECGLGYWELASWHLCAHAIIRSYQVLTAPSLIHYTHGNPMKPVFPQIEKLRWLYVISLQRFWLDPMTDSTLVRPLHALGSDLEHFDNHIIDRVMGLPSSAGQVVSSLTQLEKKSSDDQSDFNPDEFRRGIGVAGKFFEWTAGVMGWFEERLVLKGIGMDIVDLGRQLGHAANNFEKILLRPIYPTLFGLIVLLIAASL